MAETDGAAAVVFITETKQLAGKICLKV